MNNAESIDMEREALENLRREITQTEAAIDSTFVRLRLATTELESLDLKMSRIGEGGK